MTAQTETVRARYGPVMAYATLVISLLALAAAAASVLYARNQSASQGKATAIESDRRWSKVGVAGAWVIR